MLLLWLPACDPAGTAVPVPWVSSDPIEAEIRLEETFVPVDVRNTGTAAASLRLTSDGPFDIVPDTLRVEAGESETALLAVTPEDFRPIDATLTLRTALQTATVDVLLTIDADADGDGFTDDRAGGDDCDDDDPDVHPAAIEVCNDVDDDCDGTIDDDPLDLRFWYADADRDGWGASLITAACHGPAGAVLRSGDCDDTDAAISPGASERFYDGIDQDCDGGSDYDADADTYDSTMFGGTDCNDGNPDAHPGAVDPPGGSDLDCDGNP